GDYFARLWDDPLAQMPTFEIVSKGQLDAARKAPSPSETRKTHTNQNAPAPANTQPPFEAQEPAVPAANTGITASVPQDQKTSQSTAQSTTGKNIFIWNILDARPPPEIKERRLRIRYAVVSAVLADGYLPTNESLLVPFGSPSIGYYETFRLR